MKRIVKNRYLILSLLMFFLGVMIQQQYFSFNYQTSDLNNFKTSLLKKEKLSNDLADTLLAVASKDDFNQLTSKYGEKIEQLFSKYGLSFYVFNKGKMIYWTNNTLVVSETILNQKEGFIHLPNANVELIKKTNDSLSVVAFILIRQQFLYENNFLHNDFHKSFNLKSKAKTLHGNKTDKNAVFNNKNEYLFTLKIVESKNLSVIYTLAFVFFVLGSFALLFYFLSLLAYKKLKIWQFIVFFLFAFGTRFLIQFYVKTDFFSYIPLFQPKYFAACAFFPSLADLFLTTLLWLFMIFVFIQKVKTPNLNKKKYLHLFLCLFCLHIHALAAIYIFQVLIQDSSFHFEAFNLNDLDAFSGIGYFIIFIVFLGYFLLVHKIVSVLKFTFKYYTLVFFTFFISAIFILILLFFGKQIDYFSYFSVLLITLGWFYMNIYNSPRFISIVIIIALFSVYAVNYIKIKSFHRNFEEARVIAVNMAREKDPIAEIIISEVIAKCKKDTVLKSELNPQRFDYIKFYDYLKTHYFSGYLRQYNLQVTICGARDSLLVQQQVKKTYHCYSFFKQLIRKIGYETDVENLYYLQNHLGLINYLFFVDIRLPETWERVKIFIELINKPNYEVLGYPELLLKNQKKNYNEYLTKNFAKYSKNKLLSSMGDFPYAFDRSVYKHNDKEFDFFRSENFDHFVYNYNENTIILSKPTVTFFNIIISFTYLFLFFIITLIVLAILTRKLKDIVDIPFNIKNKMAFSLAVILILSMFVIAAATVFYTTTQFENNQHKLLREKIQSVLVELENKLPEIDDIEELNKNYLNDLLIKFSNIFYTDINIYNLKGELFATSRSEIFDRKLTGNKINAAAYRELFINKKVKMVHKENIGKLNYYSAYIPFSNGNNKLIAYLNLPYFSKEIELRQELSHVLVAIINLYAFLIILSLLAVIYLSNKLTAPLRLVQQRIHNLDLSKKNERIIYKGDDEIAELVNEYNKMLEELDKSAQLLAKSERESAWREMAKQIAHEIKNPLTPMKLSVQLLSKSKKNEDTDFDERFERTTATLVEHIDSLSSIASAFSQFAKIPKAHFRSVNIIDSVHSCVQIFKEYAHIKILIQNKTTDSLFVLADNERILRVFNNLIKNAVQAIDKNEKGIILIEIEQKNKSVIIKIQDNGSGISQDAKKKLFQPNFTTKTSGAGLGLAIVKNILEEVDGHIWFESEEGKGASFFISLPLLQSEQA